MSSYAEAIEFLFGLQQFGARFGLDSTRQLAARAGNPQDRLRFIHVAGTNGKGSTCAMLESVYRAAGRRVGLYTSPHLVAFGERIQIQRQLLPEGDLIRLVEQAKSWIARSALPEAPTFFEVVTVMALRYFADQACDWVIWETGLGGRLDATNIVHPLATVITQIGWDHQQWLGNTLDAIAREKAGIIKSGVPVITAATPGSGLEVIQAIAHERHAPVTVVSGLDTSRPPLSQVTLPLLGDHQRLNAAVAVATVQALATVQPVSEATLRAGLSAVHWPGRASIVKTVTGQTVLLDGAHNLPGAEALRVLLATQFRGERITLIIGMLADKDWRGIAQVLSSSAARVLLVPVRSSRGMVPTEMETAFRRGRDSVTVTCCGNLGDALEHSKADPLVVITGSLYLIGEAMEWLKLAVVPSRDERSLNDWTGPAQPSQLPSSNH